MCLNSPDLLQQDRLRWAASRTYCSPGVVNGSSALLLWQELVRVHVREHQLDRRAGQVVLELVRR